LETTIATSGYLAKRGRRDPRFTRQWFQLKGDVLSYYEEPSKIYYPTGQIDLRLALSANLADPKDKDDCHFNLTTDKREYQFKADNSSSARDWVKMLQKVIFRSRNDGDSVKISLPIENIMDVEDDRVLDFADTIKIRVIDNDETYAIDEYFFSFFTFGQEAARVLRIMVEDNNFHKAAESEVMSDSDAPDSSVMSSPRHCTHLEPPSNASVRTPALRESVRATLSPSLPVPRSLSNSRLSTDSRRSSLDVRPSLDIRRRSYDISRASSELGRRSVSHSRSRRGDRSPMSPHRQESFGSPTESEDPNTSSSAAIQSMDDTNASASQILNRSDVFQAPTIHSAHRMHSDDVPERHNRDSEDTARSIKQRPRSPRARKLHKRRTESVSPAVSVDAEKLQGSSTTYQSLIQASAYPLKGASGLAGFLRTRSKRMSNLLATESMGYLEKVSGMWQGNSKHYDAHHEGMPPDDDFPAETDGDAFRAAENFRQHFGLPQSEGLHASFFGNMQRVMPLYGKIYIGSKHFCYRSMVPGYKLKVSIEDIQKIVTNFASSLCYL
jgi:sterol 3beta-glucosyltransferase